MVGAEQLCIAVSTAATVWLPNLRANSGHCAQHMCQGLGGYDFDSG